MKVFISGPMSGIPRLNKPAFNAAEKMLKKKGYDVFNPAWLKVGKEWTHDEIMFVCCAGLDKCDAIYQLPDWSQSEGAKLEYKYAIYKNKKFI